MYVSKPHLILIIASRAHLSKKGKSVTRLQTIFTRSVNPYLPLHRAAMVWLKDDRDTDLGTDLLNLVAHFNTYRLLSDVTELEMTSRDAEQLGILLNQPPYTGQTEDIRRFLSNFEPNILPRLINSRIRRYTGQTPVHLAATNGLIECLEILLKSGGRLIWLS